MNIQEAEQTMPAQEARPVPETKDSEQPRSPVSRGRGRAFLIFFLVLLALGIGGLFYWLYERQFESTDDAQVDAHLNPVTSRVDGTITRVYVDDNQLVHTGDPLVNLDPRDFQVALDQAKAELAQARSLVTAERPNVPITEVQSITNVSTAEADVANARAALASAERDRDSLAAKLAQSKANNNKAQSDLARYKILIAKEEVSQQDYDAAVATAAAQAAAVAADEASLQAADRTVEGRKAQLAQSESKLAQYRRNAPQEIAIRRATVISNEAAAQSSQAKVESAELKLSYARITSPVNGIIMKRSAEVGSHVSAGQQLMQVAQINDIWVTANFKETQLRNLHPQQSATIHVDALRQDFAGYVESIGGSTGSVASVLPPENATGNYVKVVQRIPVRIRFKPNQSELDRLRPGMSVEPRVQIGS